MRSMRDLAFWLRQSQPCCECVYSVLRRSSPAVTRPTKCHIGSLEADQVDRAVVRLPAGDPRARLAGRSAHRKNIQPEISI